MKLINVFKTMALALGFVMITSVVSAQNTDTQQTTLNYDATNSRIGINTTSPRGPLEVSSQIVITPRATTPTATVTGTISVNSNGAVCVASNTTTGTWAKLENTASACNFSPAN